MKKYLVFLALILLFGGVYSILNSPNISVEKVDLSTTPIPTNLNSDKLWSLIQDWRKSQGFQPYIKDQRLCELADIRSTEIESELAYIPHLNFRNRVKEILGNIQVSENAAQSNTEQSILNLWLNSPSHRKALETNWKYSCVSTHGFYAVQIFSNF